MRLNLLNSRIDAYHEASQLCRDGYKVLFSVEDKSYLVLKLRHYKNESVITIYAYHDSMSIYKNRKLSKHQEYPRPLADTCKGMLVNRYRKQLEWWTHPSL